MSFFAKRSAIHSVNDVSWRYRVKKMPRREHTGDALVQSSFLLFATDRDLKDRVEDRVHAVPITGGTGGICMGIGKRDERDVTVERCGFPLSTDRGRKEDQMMKVGCSGRSGGRGMSMGSLDLRWRRWEGEGGKVQYVGPGTRRTSFWMLCGFWEQSVKEVRTKQKD